MGELGRRDPAGFYVVVAKRGAEKLAESVGGVEVEVVGDCVVIRTRSRSKAERVYERLRAAGLLK